MKNLRGQTFPRISFQVALQLRFLCNCHGRGCKKPCVDTLGPGSSVDPTCSLASEKRGARVRAIARKTSFAQKALWAERCR